MSYTTADAETAKMPEPSVARKVTYRYDLSMAPIFVKEDSTWSGVGRYGCLILSVYVIIEVDDEYDNERFVDVDCVAVAATKTGRRDKRASRGKVYIPQRYVQAFIDDAQTREWVEKP